MKKKNIVSIIGSHPGTRGEFDFSRTDADIWVFNEALNAEWCERADAVFQMHAPEIWKNPKNRNDPLHYEWLQSGDTPPIVMMEQYAEVPRAYKYPLEEIKEKFLADTNVLYFTSTVAYAIALALYLEYDRIEIYGVEMETDTEYRYQRAGVGYWVGLATGAGVDVYASCNIFKEPLYGYEGAITIDYEDFVTRINELTPLCDKQYKEFEIIRHNFDVDWALFIKTPTQERGDKLINMTKGMAHIASMFGALGGARQENERYKKKADAMIEATGDWLIVRQEFEQFGTAHAKKLTELQHEITAMAGELQSKFTAIANEKNSIRRRTKGNDFITTMNKWIERSTFLGMTDGAAKENFVYAQKIDMLVRAAGGAQSEEVLQSLKSIEYEVGQDEHQRP